ncbi:MAG: hypothetical protein JW963_08845 [Anaerolineales bacterium]|nr:hypothetical protein [Anaerolineales bacterium]
MKHNRLFLTLVVLVLASLACSLFGGGGGSSGVGDNPSSPGSGSGKYDTEFPLPSNVENFMKFEDDSINYQTSMKLTEVVDFYRDAFKSAGYTERDITTVINDTTFSIVWDGHPSGKAIVVQGVDLDNGSVNVNVRLEDV